MQKEIISNRLRIKKSVLNSVIQSVRSRKDKYENVFISRTEHEKFSISERKMREIIEELRKCGFLVKIGEKFRGLYSSNMYSMNDIFTKYIKDLNRKIVEWCRLSNPEQVLNEFGFITRGIRINGKKSLTFQKRTGQVANWKENKVTNLFNFIRDWKEITTYHLAKTLGLD